jgi:hypothetical protein
MKVEEVEAGSGGEHENQVQVPWVELYTDTILEFRIYHWKTNEKEN